MAAKKGQKMLVEIEMVKDGDPISLIRSIYSGRDEPDHVIDNCWKVNVIHVGDDTLRRAKIRMLNEVKRLIEGG